jgi:hypothetical protein
LILDKEKDIYRVYDNGNIILIPIPGNTDDNREDDRNKQDIRQTVPVTF